MFAVKLQQQPVSGIFVLHVRSKLGYLPGVCLHVVSQLVKRW
jgi:hypothetical protein